jgi:hypothetical protein
VSPNKLEKGFQVNKICLPESGENLIIADCNSYYIRSDCPHYLRLFSDTVLLHIPVQCFAQVRELVFRLPGTEDEFMTKI